MCIGNPMPILSVHEHYAICDDRGKPVEVDTRLVGECRPGQWLLVFLGAARELLDENRAREMQDALAAVEGIMNGNLNRVDHLFSDLIDREPPVPDHLKPLIGDKS